MAEIKCPHCGKEIQLDKSDYDALLNNVEKEEIEKRVAEQQKLIEEKYKAKYENNLNLEKNKQNSTVQELNHQIELLKQQLANSGKDSELAVSDAVAKEQEKLAAKEQEILRLKAELDKADANKQIELAKALEIEKAKLAEKEKEIAKLQGDIAQSNTNTELAVQKAVAEEQRKIAEKEQKIIV